MGLLSFGNVQLFLFKGTLPAKVHMFPLYFMTHVRDGGPNYKTSVNVQFIHTPITLIKFWVIELLFFFHNLIAIRIFQNVLRPIWAIAQCVHTLTILLQVEFIQPFYQPFQLFHHGLLPHGPFMLYNSPNEVLISLSLLLFLHL